MVWILIFHYNSRSDKLGDDYSTSDSSLSDVKSEDDWSPWKCRHFHGKNSLAVRYEPTKCPKCAEFLDLLTSPIGNDRTEGIINLFLISRKTLVWLDVICDGCQKNRSTVKKPDKFSQRKWWYRCTCRNQTAHTGKQNAYYCPQCVYELKDNDTDADSNVSDN